MLPTPTDNGVRLAAILPTALASLARGIGGDTATVLRHALPHHSPERPIPDVPPVKSLVFIVVDGLGYSNLKAASAYARTLSRLQTKRIETVIPSTTGAALTTLTTGRLPGEHGLIGYKIRHPEIGLVSTLKDWQGIEDRQAWQRSEPLFALASGLGARAAVIGRPAHATGGLTESILKGAEYHSGQTIAERFSIASRLLRGSDPVLAYLYVDELDRAAHHDGWQSAAWTQRLEQFDAALHELLRTLPADVGVVVTADHGMLDIEPERRLVLDDGSVPLEQVAEIGGEPRFRSLYLHPGADPFEVSRELGVELAKRAWVGTREEAISRGWFGPISADVAQRLGEVLVLARGMHAFQLHGDDAAARAMVGQHGGLSDEERGVPLCAGGSLMNSNFASAVAAIAKQVLPPSSEQE